MFINLFKYRTYLIKRPGVYLLATSVEGRSNEMGA